MALVLTWITLQVTAGLFIPWWFNPDEVVFYAETIRRLRLDPAQTFFDIPGTPYITTTSLLTWLWWVAERILGLTVASPSDFAFQNVQAVHTLMRSVTLVLYVIAVGLTYDLFRRTAGALTAAGAALLLATLPIHVHYSHFARTESLGLVLSLACLWLVLHPRFSHKWSTYLAAGFLAGGAVGARYHFALVGLPMLVAVHLLEDRPQFARERPLPPRPVLLAAGAALAALFLSGAAITLLLNTGAIPPGPLTHTMLLTTPAGEAQYAGAKHILGRLWLILGVASAAGLGAYRFGARWRCLQSFINSFTLAIAIGFAAGVVLSHPTFLWRGDYQLRSIEFYSNWIDPELEGLGWLRSWTSVTRYYFETALPEPWLRAAFLAGAVLIVVGRKPAHIVFLIGATVCFVAHPVTMRRWPHHIIPWLPFLCFVTMYPAGWAAALATRRFPAPALRAALVVAMAAFLTFLVLPRFSKAGDYVKISKARTDSIAELNRWLADQVPSDKYLLLSFFCLNEDGFLKYIENTGVRVPENVPRRHQVHVWWLDRAAIEHREGYLCVTEADVTILREDAERRSPGSTYSPFGDERFQPLVIVGAGIYGLHVFRFDFRRSAGGP